MARVAEAARQSMGTFALKSSLDAGRQVAALLASTPSPAVLASISSGGSAAAQEALVMAGINYQFLMANGARIVRMLDVYSTGHHIDLRV